MLEDRTLLSVVFEAGLAAAPATNRPDIATGLISGNTEVALAFSDAVPGNIAVANQGNLIVSTDAGANFSTPVLNYTTNLLAVTTFTSGSGDPDVVYDADGRLFWTNLARLPAGSTPRTRTIAIAQINADDGTSVTSPSFIPLNPTLPNSANTSADKQFMAADADPLLISPFANNLYMVWTELSGTLRRQPNGGLD